MSRTRMLVSLAATIGLVALAAAAAVTAFPLQSAGSDVYRVGKGVTPPVVVHKVEPKYTEEALAAKLEGKVVVSVEIWPDGKVHNARVKEGLGMGLDEAAVAALAQWEFKPGLKGGKPVKVQATVEINFKLK